MFVSLKRALLGALILAACTVERAPVAGTPPNLPPVVDSSVVLEKTAAINALADTDTRRGAAAGASSSVTHNNLWLVIPLGRGKTIVFDDDTTAGSRTIVHEYLGHLVPLHSHLVRLRYYESWSYLLVDDSTGDTTRIAAEPVISPDGKRFAVTSGGGFGDDEEPTIVEVWRVTPGKPEREFSYEPTGYAPSDAMWRDSTSIDFTTNTYIDSAEPRKNIAHLKRNGTTWVLSQR